MSAGILCTDNATMTAEKENTGQDTAGGDDPNFATVVATGIGGLFTLFSSLGPGDFMGMAPRNRARFTSDNPVIGRADIRLKLTATDDDSLASLIGTYWRVENAVNHPAGRGGLRDARYSAELSQLVQAY